MIVVTGSTGTIGRELVRLLSAAGAEVRAVSRYPTKAHDLPHVTPYGADLREVAQVETALGGASSVFLLTGNDAEFAPTQTGVIDVAARQNIAFLVKLSALGASDHSRSGIGRDHWVVEQALQRTAIPWTILRPHAFMQNWLGEVAETVRAENTIYSPIGDGRVPFIDTRDIADVAAEVLLRREGHIGKKYVLTGGAAVGYADLATALSDATGRRIVYRPISLEDARSRLARRGVPAALIDANLALAEYQRAGGPTAQVSPTVRNLLGRPPRTIADFARDYASAFGPAGR